MFKYVHYLYTRMVYMHTSMAVTGQLGDSVLSFHRLGLGVEPRLGSAASASPAKPSHYLLPHKKNLRRPYMLSEKILGWSEGTGQPSGPLLCHHPSPYDRRFSTLSFITMLDTPTLLRPSPSPPGPCLGSSVPHFLAADKPLALQQVLHHVPGTAARTAGERPRVLRNSWDKVWRHPL